MGVEAQHVHVGLPCQLDVRSQEIFAGRVEKKFAAVIGAAHEHRPAVDGVGPAFSSGLQADLANAERLAQVGTLAFVGGDLDLGPVEGGVAVRPRIPQLGIGKGELDGQFLDVVAVEPEGPPHFEGCAEFEIIGSNPDQQLAGHDPAIQVTQPRPQRQTGEVTLLEASLAVHPLGDDVPNLLEQDRLPEAHGDVPDVLLAKAPQFAARIGLRVRVVEEAHQVAFRREVGLDGRLDADGKNVLFEQERRDIKRKRREVAVVAAEQAAVQPDVGDQERPFETK